MKKSAHQIWKKAKEQGLTKEEFKEKLIENNVIVPKIKICEVAVVTPRYRDFQIWLRENEKPNEKYTWIDEINSVRGIMFDRVEKLYNYDEIKDIDDVLDYLETHLRSNRT